MNKKFTLASFFAGVGGIDMGFEQTGRVRTIYANEFDEYPAKTFEMNFQVKVDTRSICDVKPCEVPDADIICGGFPCQAFSVAGLQQGFEDEKGRGTLFFELLRIIRENYPRVIFLENVKNLLNHDDGRTFEIILDALEDSGYQCRYKVMNASEFGNIPQNRERVYIVGFREEEDFNKFHFPLAIPLKTKLSDIIDFENPVAEKYYYTEGKYKGDIYDKLKESMDDSNTTYQWRRHYVRKNAQGVVPTLTANMGGGGHNVPLVLTKHGIRKLTPRECFNAQGFPSDFRLPTDMTESRIYKQAGNSVCVSVIHRIAEAIVEAIS